MKTTHTAAALTTVAVLGLCLAATTATASTTPTESTSSSLASTLSFNREEERMAQDLYAALAAKYDQARPMSMITRSETQHFDSIGTLLSTHDVTDPSAGLPAGTYAFPELQALYDGWLAKGNTSINAAYQVGVELEKRDIADLQKAIDQTTEADVLATYERLLAASKNHLAAYERAVAGDTQAGSGLGSMNGPAKGNQQGAGVGRYGKGMNGKGMSGRSQGAGQQHGSESCPMQG
ncbi:MAG TPA: DUF2202 domain-containing protein [Candidatus Nanopelagicales bacterium]|nr:DUF2202 domain-containing protein [Candidatus Nanopelagicales bacterium]